MGKIYFNPKTGEFFVASISKRKPPSKDFKYTGYKTFWKKYLVLKSYYCKECGEYHGLVNQSKSGSPLGFEMEYELGRKYGCKTAGKIMNLASELGGRRNHYIIAEKLYNMGVDLIRLTKLISKLPSQVRRKAINMIFTEGIETAEAYLISYVINNTC